MQYVIFSLPSTIHEAAKITRFLDTKKALQELKGDTILCVGQYEGNMEWSILMLYEDFTNLLLDSPYLKEQEKFVLGSTDKRNHVSWLYPDGASEYAGHMKEISKEQTLDYSGWTYRMDQDKYYTIVPWEDMYK